MNKKKDNYTTISTMFFSLNQEDQKISLWLELETIYFISLNNLIKFQVLSNVLLLERLVGEVHFKSHV